MVRLDADIADYFENAEAVNKVLRMFVEASLLVKKPEPKAEPAIEPENRRDALRGNGPRDDDEAEYGEALELARLKPKKPRKPRNRLRPPKRPKRLKKPPKKTRRSPNKDGSATLRTRAPARRPTPAPRPKASGARF